ncbi:hypothetical protein L227DRAFT_109511 [Lentinus tigrinus ALCF2SS1-6]|uniref:Uncharacterized protein n=1 Tax=Lentinus tigrinus ALCF2SS1-6 TaxID=1328759 RepID=A0A5C2S8I7_9APHY|nr:hypothetical protein L227DRAFT_109511 [Lentinus tigrinus ALCF2SS1-6]
MPQFANASTSPLFGINVNVSTEAQIGKPGCGRLLHRFTVKNWNPISMQTEPAGACPGRHHQTDSTFVWLRERVNPIHGLVVALITVLIHSVWYHLVYIRTLDHPPIYTLDELSFYHCLKEAIRTQCCL